MEKENNQQSPAIPNKKVMLSNARRLRKNQTDAEQCLWQQLRGRSLVGLKFRRQHPVGPYICDFVCVDQKLIIEIDGGQHATNREKDAVRTAYLQSQGFRVIRFWNHEVLAATEAVLERILKRIESDSPSP
ncbi:endonuclease domain-containing protein [uncultured Desulfosarcina sp.]|uniref:endonuclease domain-containing protein n=1 Tax=uncultured Desulfosarcina sp. TaxID=218289 RepID=UPI0029C74FD8|nr:endonuclease domain-containing protein [uncultured Desulfosarcina sp.]